MTMDVPDYLRRAMVAHGVDPDATAEAAAALDLDAPDTSTATGPIPPAPPAAVEQLPLPDDNRLGQFSDPERSGAPDTQREAAVGVYPRSGTMRRRVLDVIGERGERGATDEEIETALRMRHQSASARRYELLHDGWVRDSGETRTTSSGREATVWTLSEQGTRQWEPRRGSTWEPSAA